MIKGSLFFQKIPDKQELDSNDLIILLGAFPRTDIPIANIALRHSIDRGSKAIVIDTHHREYNHHVESKKIVPPSKFVSELKRF